MPRALGTEDALGKLLGTIISLTIKIRRMQKSSEECITEHLMLQRTHNGYPVKTEHRWQGSHRGYLFFFFGTSSYHMSSSEEYSVAPSKASGGRYQSVTTSEE